MDRREPREIALARKYKDAGGGELAAGIVLNRSLLLLIVTSCYRNTSKLFSCVDLLYVVLGDRCVAGTPVPTKICFWISCW